MNVRTIVEMIEGSVVWSWAPEPLTVNRATTLTLSQQISRVSGQPWAINVWFNGSVIYGVTRGLGTSYHDFLFTIIAVTGPVFVQRTMTRTTLVVSISGFLDGILSRFGPCSHLVESTQEYITTRVQRPSSKCNKVTILLHHVGGDQDRKSVV